MWNHSRPTKSVKICAPHSLTQHQAPQHHHCNAFLTRKQRHRPPRRAGAGASSQPVPGERREKLYFTHPQNRPGSRVAAGRSNHLKQMYISAPNRLPESILPSQPIKINGEKNTQRKNANYPGWSVPKSEQLTHPKCVNNCPQYFNVFSNWELSFLHSFHLQNSAPYNSVSISNLLKD